MWTRQERKRVRASLQGLRVMTAQVHNRKMNKKWTKNKDGLGSSIH
jgi:hypothetical protein